MSARRLSLALWAVMAAAWPGDVCRAQWVESRAAGPFVCTAEFPLKSYERLLGELADLQTDLVRYLGVPPARQRIDVLLFRDESSYHRYLRQNLPNVPYRRALFVKSDGEGRVYAYRSRQLPVDLRHECTHALLHAVLPMVPLWLDEGLAEYFEVPQEQRAFDHPDLGPLRWNLRFGMVPKLESLEQKGGLSEMGRTEYRYSWAWVHFMLHGPPEAHEEMVGYLADVRASTPPGQLSHRLRQRLNTPRDRLMAHFRCWKR